MFTVSKDSTLANYYNYYDELVLVHLQDIKSKLHESPMDFTLEFTLQKTNILQTKFSVNMKDIIATKYKPFNIDGPKI